MGDLCVAQAGYVQGASVQPQKVVGADVECVGDAYKHIQRGENIVVFPVADALLGDGKFFCHLHLIVTQRETQLFKSFAEQC